MVSLYTEHIRYADMHGTCVTGCLKTLADVYVGVTVMARRLLCWFAEQQTW
jgi:hypothetical protein